MNTSDEDAVLPVSIGTAIWLALFIILIARKSSLDENGTGWWIAVAAVGLVSGIGGVIFLRWRRGRVRSDRAPADPS